MNKKQPHPMLLRVPTKNGMTFYVQAKKPLPPPFKKYLQDIASYGQVQKKT